MSTLTAKCTKKTKPLISAFLLKNTLITELKIRYGIVPNYSWLTKFSIKCLLENIDNLSPQELTFAYDCHYVDKFDEMLISYLRKYQNKFN